LQEIRVHSNIVSAWAVAVERARVKIFLEAFRRRVAAHSGSMRQKGHIAISQGQVCLDLAVTLSHPYKDAMSALVRWVDEQGSVGPTQEAEFSVCSANFHILCA
jgi:hypothetical protein